MAGLLPLAVLALFSGLVVWIAARRRRGNPVLARTGTAFVPLPPHDAYQALTEVVPAGLPVTSLSFVPSEHRIEIRTQMGLRSFGEDIEIVVEESDGGSKVRVLSMPAYWLTAIDYGKNTSNVRVILEAVIATCGGHLPETPTEQSRKT